MNFIAYPRRILKKSFTKDKKNVRVDRGTPMFSMILDYFGVGPVCIGSYLADSGDDEYGLMTFLFSVTGFKYYQDKDTLYIYGVSVSFQGVNYKKKDSLKEIFKGIIPSVSEMV